MRLWVFPKLTGAIIHELALMPAYQIDDLYSDVAQVQHKRPDLFGSGRLVGRNLILTARHVVTPPDATEPIIAGWEVRLFGAKPRSTGLWEWHRSKRDLARQGRAGLSPDRY